MHPSQLDIPLRLLLNPQVKQLLIQPGRVRRRRLAEYPRRAQMRVRWLGLLPRLNAEMSWGGAVGASERMALSRMV